MSVWARPLLVPGVALAAAASVALSPVLVTPPAAGEAHAAAALPVLHVEDVALAGIGQNIYYAITPTVQYVVGGASYLINFIPLIGGVIAAQININYFQGIQPVVEATVNYLASIVQNPLNIINNSAAYGGALYDIGYNWLSAEAVFFGFPPLPPLPQTASTANPASSAASPAAPRAGARAPRGDRSVPAGATKTAHPRAGAGARAAATKSRGPRQSAAHR